MSENETIERTPANENPWYWLATVYGEQDEEVFWPHFDYAIAEKNRVGWNRWMAPALGEERRAELLAKGFPAAELTRFDDAERAEFLKDFATRAGDPDAAPPDPETGVSFWRVEFARATYFDGFVFVGDAHFSEAAISKITSFDGAAFSDSTSFECTEFSGRASFCGTAFFDGVSFDGAEFSQYVFFDRAKFSGSAFLGAAEISDVNVVELAFASNASFCETSFTSHVSFIATEFSENVSFSDAVFSGDAVFDGAKFSGLSSFKGARFSRLADFVGAAFGSRTSFTKAKFFNCAPDFRNAKLPEATEWHGATWPPPPQSEDEAQPQIYAYEKLKAEMERLKKHADEQFFFAKELRARRALEPFLSLKWLLYFTYEQFGGYGQSVVRPLVWLALFWAAGAGLFALLPAADGRPLEYDDAARLSLINLVPFLPYKPGDEIMKHLAAWAEWFGIFQAIIGAILLFLFGLALRNLFRMK